MSDFNSFSPLTTNSNSLPSSTPLKKEENKVKNPSSSSENEKVRDVKKRVLSALKDRVKVTFHAIKKNQSAIYQFVKNFKLKSGGSDEGNCLIRNSVDEKKTNSDNWLLQVWDDGKGHVAEESVERIDTVSFIKEAAIAEKLEIQKLLKNEKSIPKREQMEQRIKELDNRIKKAEESKVTWGNSDFFRDLLKQKFLNIKISSSLEDKIKNYAEVMKNEYDIFSPPINMRFHVCLLQGNGILNQLGKGWLRLGVITDLSNGYVNLENLNALKTKLEENDKAEADAIRNEMVKDILSALKNNQKNEAAFVTAGFALQELGFTYQQIQSLFVDLKVKPADMVIPTISMEAKEKILETAQKREKILTAQFLQMTIENLKRAKGEQLKSGEFKMLHVSLLNQRSKSIDPTGWNHDEKNEMLDMAAIFEKFDNSKLICDGKGPFVDEDGNIHLPKGIPYIEYGEDKTLTLRSLFVNQCVQGSFSFQDLKESPLINEGDQKRLNDAAIKKLETMGTYQQDINQPGMVQPGINKTGMTNILKAKKTGFKTAAELISLADNAGFHVSTGCLSAKDRTGFVSALVSDSVMAAFPKKSRIKFMREQLKKSSISVKVVKENTGAEFMKLTDFRLEGITKNNFNLKSIAVRADVYVKQILGLIKG